MRLVIAYYINQESMLSTCKHIMFLQIVNVLANSHIVGGSFFVQSKHVALLSMTCRKLRCMLAPLAKVLPVDEGYSALIDGVHRLKDCSSMLHFRVSKDYERQTLSICCTAGFGLTSGSELSVSLRANPKKAAMRELAMHQLYLTLMSGVLDLRPAAAELHCTRRSFFCIERLADRTQIYFVVSRHPSQQTVTVYCTRPTHPYVVVVTPAALVRPTRFFGRLTFVNLRTGNKVATDFGIARAWYLHGLPRNIENGHVGITGP
jgi:hypothetical protein